MRQKFRFKFLFIGGLLFAVVIVLLQLLSPVPEVASIQDNSKQNIPIENIEQEAESSIEELRRENQTLTKLQDKLVREYLALRKERDAANTQIEELKESKGESESSLVAKLNQERDKYRRDYELAQIQIQQLSQEKQGKLRLSDELDVLNKRSRSLQKEVERLEGERSQLAIELSKSKSELESVRSGRSSLLQEAEALRSQAKKDSSRIAKLKSELSQGVSEHSAQTQQLKNELQASRAETQGLDAAIKTLRSELAQSKTKNEEAQQKIVKLEKEITDLQSVKKSLAKETEAKEKLITDLADARKLLITRSNENDKLIVKVRELKASDEKRDKEFALLKKSKAGQSEYIEQCDSQLSDARSKLIGYTELERQFVQLQNELLLKNTEIEIYSGGKQGTDPDIGKSRVVRSPAQELRSRNSSSSSADNALRNPVIVTPSSAPRELIVEITASKGQLRAGPGKEHGVLMHMREGARLVVEDKQGEWYRILTPTGTRAYVHQEIVKTVSQSPTANILNHRTPAKQPNSIFDISPEEAAMQELKRGVSGR